MTAPAAGSTEFTGIAFDIVYSAPAAGSYINILLYYSATNTAYGYMAYATSNDGVFNAYLPNGLPTGEAYFVVQSFEDPSTMGRSGTFTIENGGMCHFGPYALLHHRGYIYRPLLNMLALLFMIITSLYLSISLSDPFFRCDDLRSGPILFVCVGLHAEFLVYSARIPCRHPDSVPVSTGESIRHSSYRCHRRCLTNLGGMADSRKRALWKILDCRHPPWNILSDLCCCSTVPIQLC